MDAALAQCIRRWLYVYEDVHCVSVSAHSILLVWRSIYTSTNVIVVVYRAKRRSMNIVSSAMAVFTWYWVRIDAFHFKNHTWKWCIEQVREWWASLCNRIVSLFCVRVVSV